MKSWKILLMLLDFLSMCVILTDVILICLNCDLKIMAFSIICQLFELIFIFFLGVNVVIFTNSLEETLSFCTVGGCKS